LKRNNVCSIFRKVFVIAALVSYGYGQSALAADRPSHEAALTQIRQALPDNAEFTATNFRYANGYALDANRYVVVVTYKLNMKVSSDPDNVGKKTPNQDFGDALAEVALALKLGHFEPGDSFDAAQEWIFQNTENGWILQGPKGDAEVTARHTPNAAAVNQQKEQAEKAREEEGRREAQQFHANLQAREDAIAQACAAGQQLHVTTGPLHPQNMQGAGTFDQWVYQGQVVNPVPGGSPPHMCHVQYVSRGHVVSGYIQLNALAVN